MPGCGPTIILGRQSQTRIPFNSSGSITLSLISLGHPSPWPSVGQEISAPWIHNSKACYSRVAKWVNYCEASQPKCIEAEATELLNRVISVGEDEDSPELALIGPDHLSGQYIALSYC